MANLGQNLVEQQYELENVPMQRLVQMAQQPDGLFPQYLVLTELERRNRYKQAYDAEKASMVGDTTVAQDLVNESVSEPPAGINTLGPSSSLSNQVNPAGGIAQAGPQMMADGGAVRYNEGRNVRMDTKEVRVHPSQYYNPDQANTRLTYDEWMEVTGQKLADAKASWNPFDSYDPTDEEKEFFSNLTDEEYKALKEEYYSPISEEGLENLEGLYDNRKRWGAFGKKGFGLEGGEGDFLSGMAKYFSPIRRDSENMLGIGFNPNFFLSTMHGFGDANTRSDYYGTEGLYTSEGKSPVEFTNHGYAAEMQSYKPIANLPPDFEYAPTEMIKELGFGVEGGTVKDGVKSKLYKEGGLTSLDTSIPKPTREQIAKAREMYPDADYETILDIAAGIDTMDITTNENRYKTGGIARFNQGRNIPYIGVSSMAGPYMPDPYYMKGPDDLPGADKYIQEENAQNARARANQIIADLEAKYGVGNIPLAEYKKVEDILKEADLYDDIIEKRKVEEYEKKLEEQAEAEKYGVKTEEIVKPQSVIEAEEKEAALVEKSDELDVEDSDYIADQVERYAGILGLPSKEERERNKTTSLLFGLGSAISQATQPGDIAKGFPGIHKMLVAEDRQASKDRLGILNLLATQDKRQTLSRKDRLTIIQNRIEDLRKELEQPAITGGRTPEDIQEEIRQLSAIINAATGVGPQTSGNILKAKSYVGG